MNNFFHMHGSRCIKFSSFVAVLAAWLISGCGRSQKSSSSSSFGGAEQAKPLLIALSGFSTCDDSTARPIVPGPAGSKVYMRALVAASQLETVFGVKPAVVTTCYTGDRELMESASASDWIVTKPTEEEFFNDVRQQMAEATHVYIIGHSYGGWLALRLVDSAVYGDASSVKALFSVDPISKIRCSFSTLSGCFSAPEDIEVRSRQHIKNATDVWVNPWQNQTFYLHSSAIDEADRNPNIPLSHQSMPESDVVWSDFKDQFKR